MITHLRLCRGNLVESAEYAALLTDSLMSSVDSITLSNVALHGGRDKTIVFRTSFKNETTPTIRCKKKKSGINNWEVIKNYLAYSILFIV
jgi:hypothetical protein